MQFYLIPEILENSKFWWNSKILENANSCMVTEGNWLSGNGGKNKKEYEWTQGKYAGFRICSLS